MAPNKPALSLSAAEEDAVIKERLITKTGTTIKETWQKKLMLLFAGFSNSLMSDADLEESDRYFDHLMDGLKIMTLPVQKSFLGVEASRRDAKVADDLHQKTLQQIVDTSAEIERLKGELDAARIERQNQEECEVIRETIAAQPSRAQSAKSIKETQKEIADMEREMVAMALAVEHRNKQFSLLMHVIDSIQTEIQEEKFLAIVRNHQEPGREETSSAGMAVDPMIVDEG